MNADPGDLRDGADWAPVLRRAVRRFVRWAQDDPVMAGFLVLIVIMGVVVIFTG